MSKKQKGHNGSEKIPMHIMQSTKTDNKTKEESETCNIDKYDPIDCKWIIVSIVVFLLRYVSAVLLVIGGNELKNIWSQYDQSEIEAQCNGKYSPEFTINSYIYTEGQVDAEAELWANGMVNLGIGACCIPFVCCCCAMFQCVGGVDKEKYGTLMALFCLLPSIGFNVTLSIITMLHWSAARSLDANVSEFCDPNLSIYQQNNHLFIWLNPLIILDVVTFTAVVIGPCIICCVWSYYTMKKIENEEDDNDENISEKFETYD